MAINTNEHPSVLRSMQAALTKGIGRISQWTRGASKEPFQEDLVKLVDDEFDRRRSERMPLELGWRLNMAFIGGDQYCDIDAVNQLLVESPRTAWWEHREVHNHMAPIIETRMAKIGRMQPKLAIRPASGDMEDLSSAKIGMKLVDHCDRERLDEDQRQAFYAWLEQTGTCILKQTWDPTAGRIVGYVQLELLDEHPEPARPPLQEPESDPMESLGAKAAEELEQAKNAAKPVDMVEEESGVRARTMMEVHEGDLRSDVIPPFEIYPDSLLRPQVEDCRSIIHARAYHATEIKSIWGHEVSPDTDLESWGYHEYTEARGALGYGSQGYRHSSASLQDHVLVKEYWEKPSMEYPEGRLIVVANKTLLHSGPLPYKVDKDNSPGLPFVKVVDIVRPGQFFGACVADRLVPIQREYNAWSNKKAEYDARVAVGDLVMEQDSVEDTVQVEQNMGAPGNVFWIKRGTQRAPEWMQFPNLPGSFENEGPRLLNEFTIISGVSETTRFSEAPSGVKSGVALDMIIDQDNTRLSHTVGNIEQGKVKWAKQVLRFYKQFADHTRILKTTGSDNSVDILYWDGSDITSDDVIIDTSALMSDTPAQRRQTVMEMLGAGLFSDPDTGRLTREGKAKVFEMLQWGTWEQGNDVDDMQIKVAKRENHEMSQGMMPPVKEYHHEELHIAEHVKFMLTDEFREMDMKTQGMLEALVNQHIQQHMMIRLRKMLAIQSQMAAQMPQNQGGGESNVPS